jgi:hypothetical protein
MTDNNCYYQKARAVSSRCRTKIQHVTNFITEYNFRIKDERIITPTENKTDQYSSFLDSRDILYKQNLLWTKKISE